MSKFPVAASPHWRHFCSAVAGRIPGEALRPKDVDRLIVLLHGLGWTDVEIATHTRWSTYTVGRIRERLGLDPNKAREMAA